MSQLNALTQLCAKQRDPGDYTKIIAGDYTNSNLSPASDYTNINRSMDEGFTTINHPKLNQRTNGPVNAHLISWPSKAQNKQNLENIW